MERIEEFELSTKLNIIKCLKQKKHYSYNNLKEINNLYDDNKLFNYLLEIIKDAIKNFNFETPVYYNKYLYKCFEYLEINVEKIDLSNNELLIKKINEINKLIFNKIKKDFIKPNNKLYISNKTFLISIANELNYVINNLKHGDLDINELEYELYSILYELIFEIKNPIYVEEIINMYPNICNVKKENRTLFENILDKYFNVLLNKNDDYELIYYNRIVNTFVKNFKNQNNEDMLQLLIYKSNKILDSMDNRKLSKNKKERILYFLNEIINYETNIKRKNSEIINNLRIKYNLKNNLENDKIINPNWKLYKKSDKYVITIDDDNAQIFETGISLDYLSDGGYKLGLYVIDVNQYIKNNETLKKNAYERALSIHGFPMFPNKLATKKLSLNKGKYVCTIAHLFEFDPQLNVRKFKVERKIIKVKANLKFSEINQILKSNDKTRLKNQLTKIIVFSRFIRKNEEIKDYHEIKDITNKLLYNIEYDDNPKRKIGINTVSDYQIFLNSFIANYCYKMNLPYLYRNNNFNRSFELIEEIKGKYKDNESITEIINMIHSIYEPSKYSVINEGHLGLNLEAYGEVSKPVRSLASLVNQKLITDYLIDNVYIDSEKNKKIIHELTKICDHINEKKELYDGYLYELNKVKKREKRR